MNNWKAKIALLPWEGRGHSAHAHTGQSNISGQSWPQFALFLDFYIRLQVSQHKISWICLSCSEAELKFWVDRKFLGWTPLLCMCWMAPLAIHSLRKSYVIIMSVFHCSFAKNLMPRCETELFFWLKRWACWIIYCPLFAHMTCSRMTASRL